MIRRTRRERASGPSAWLAFVLVACSCRPVAQGDPLVVAPVPFRHVVLDAAPNTGADCCTDVLALGDLDGDGDLDAVLGAEGAHAGGLSWYEAPDWTRRPVADGEFTTDGQIADVDGDGDQDIVTCNHGRGLFWYGNDGDPRHGTWPPRFIGPGYAHDLEVGDVDHDGDLDVVVTDKQRVVLWERWGPAPEEPGSWRAVTLLVRPGEGLALADLDRDGDLDVVFGGSWLECPDDLASPWPEHVFAPDWAADTRARAADLDGDGRLDIVLSVSEDVGPLAWFSAPEDPRTVPWRREQIAPASLEGAHSLQVADLDADGDLDVVTAEMHSSRQKRVVAYLDEGPAGWTEQVLSVAGSHDLRVGDLDGDGDVDLVGKNYAGPGRVLEAWENLSADLFAGLPASTTDWLAPGWEHVAIDGKRPASQWTKMGLAFADVDADGLVDVAAGSYLYVNPGGPARGPWPRVELAEGLDVYLALDVDGDARADFVGASGEDVLWLEAGPTALEWTSRRVARLPPGWTQGYCMAQLWSDGPPQVVLTRGENLFALDVTPEGPWTVQRLATTSEEGVAAGDVDRDGDVDLVAQHADGHRTIWLENPGRREGEWREHVVAASDRWVDRVALADVNGDGRLDVVTTEESQNWEHDADVAWYEAPEDPRAHDWRRHRLTTLRSANSLDVADLDGDGDVDVAVAEHTDQRDASAAPNTVLLLLENVDGGRAWRPHPIEIGSHSSHLGARLVDLDHDGRMEIVSLAWRQFAFLHLWRQTAGAALAADGRWPPPR